MPVNALPLDWRAPQLAFTARLGLPPSLYLMRLAYEMPAALKPLSTSNRYPAARNNAKSPAAIGYMRPIAAGVIFASELVAAVRNCRLGMR